MYRELENLSLVFVLGVFLIACARGKITLPTLAAAQPPAVISGPLDPFINESARRYDLDPLIIRAMIDKENNPKNDHVLCQQKEEAAWYYEAKKLAKRGESDKQIRRMASSLGVMQVVYAAHVKDCGLKSTEDLCNPQKNIECGAKFLRFLINRRSDASKPKWYIHDIKKRIETAVRDYNGVDAPNQQYLKDVRRFYNLRRRPS